MAIAELTHLHITIPASGSVTEAVPEDCFPHVPLPRVLVSFRRVSFASKVTVLGTVPESLADREPTSLGPPAPPEPVLVDLLDIFMNRSIRCSLRRILRTLPLWFRNWTFRCFRPAGFRSLHLAGGHSGTGQHPFNV